MINLTGQIHTFLEQLHVICEKNKLNYSPQEGKTNKYASASALRNKYKRIKIMPRPSLFTYVCAPTLIRHFPQMKS